MIYYIKEVSVMKKAFIVYFRILKKLPITTSVTTLLIVLCFVYMNFYGMIFLLLLIPGLVFADFMIKLPFIAHRDMKHTAKLYGCADTPFRQALKDIFK